jgi:hypothetical protein
MKSKKMITLVKLCSLLLLTYTSLITTDYYDEVGDFTIFAEMDYRKILKNGNKKRGFKPLFLSHIFT